FLQIVAFAGDIAHDFMTVGQSHLGHLTQRRVRLLGRGGVNARAHAALLRTALQRRNLVPGLLRLPPLGDQLIDGRHLALVTLTSASLARPAPCFGYPRRSFGFRPKPQRSRRSTRDDPSGWYYPPHGSNETCGLGLPIKGSGTACIRCLRTTTAQRR